MTNDVGFMELVEIHERRWGTKQYPGRPTLKELMESPIVAVWAQAGGVTLSVYQTADEINQAVTHVFTSATFKDTRRLVKIFNRQQPMSFSLQIVKIHDEHPTKAEMPQSQIAAKKFVLPEVSDVSRGATYQPEVVKRNADYQPQTVDTNPQREERYIQPNITPFFKVQEAQPARYGYTAPGRNPTKLPGRKKQLIKKINSAATDDEKPEDAHNNGNGRAKGLLKKLRDDGK